MKFLEIKQTEMRSACGGVAYRRNGIVSAGVSSSELKRFTGRYMKEKRPTFFGLSGALRTYRSLSGGLTSKTVLSE
jgi:hypothetical protein